MKKWLLILIAFEFVSAYAHEGHDHNSPSAVPAPKGGLIKSLEKTHVELVYSKNEIKIYCYDKTMKPQKTERYLINAKAQLPRSQSIKEVVLVSQDRHFTGTFDAKGMHRYTLILQIKDLQTGHDDQLTFTIEPKK